MITFGIAVVRTACVYSTIYTKGTNMKSGTQWTQIHFKKPPALNQQFSLEYPQKRI